MVKVDSTAIHEVEYDAAAQRLDLRFADGDWYSYAAVPPEVVLALLEAESLGRFFQEHIRDRYAYRKR